MYDHALYRARKHYCHYCLQALSTEEVLKDHFKYCFKINIKQKIRILKTGESIKFKYFERKIKPPFMILKVF